MFVSRPAVQPLEVVAAPPPANPPAGQQQPQPQPQPQPQHPQPQQPQQQQAPAPPPPQQEPELPQGVEHPQNVLMKDVPGMAGTPGALALRIMQLLFAGMSLAIMTSTDDFPTVTAFCTLIAAVILQVGDMITGGFTMLGACAAAGITVLIDNDLDICSENHCARFQSAVAMTFMCWFSIAPTCVLNLLSLATGR